MKHCRFIPILLAGLACSTPAKRAKVGVDPLLRAQRTPDKTPVDDGAPLGRLPEDVVPVDYAVNLSIDPRNESFSGVASIRVTLTRPRSHLWLHGAALRVKQAQVTLADGSTRRVQYQQLTPDGVVRLAFPAEFAPQTIRIGIAYDAEFSDNLRGLYTVKESGQSYVFSRFQATDARRAFPCFDEPRFKTPFFLTVTVPEEMKVFATTEIEKVLESEGDRRTVAFRETMRLPTNSLTLAVGAFDVVDSEIPPNTVRKRSIMLRGIAMSGKAASLAYAMENIVPLLEILETYFDLPYPYKKLDLVAVPNLAGAAMESVGVLTFQEHFLLFDKESASRGKTRRFARLLAHELAQQWFGNLVTVPWWNDFWIIESFAAWVGAQVVDRWQPEMQSLIRLSREVYKAMERDSLVTARTIREPIESIRDISNSFDRFTYSKGAGVLRMFEGFIGEAAFRDGMRVHVKRFANGSASAEDLIDSFSEVSGKELGPAFMSFLNQQGVPLLESRLQCVGEVGRVAIRQARYLPTGSLGRRDREWKVPVCWRAEVSGEERAECLLLEEREAEISFEEGCPQWWLPNAGGTGYYRFSLEPSAMRALVDARAKLDVNERLALVDSLHAAWLSQSIDASTYFEAIRRLAQDGEGSVVSSILDGLWQVYESLVSKDAMPSFRQYARELFGKRFRGLDIARRADDTPADREMRVELLEFLVFVARDPATRDRAAELGRALVVEGSIPSAGQYADVAEILLAAAVQRYDEAFVNVLVELLASTTDPRDRGVILGALGAVDDDALIEGVWRLALGETLRHNERFSLLSSFAGRREYAPLLWLWTRENFDTLANLLPPQGAGRMPSLASGLCDAAAPAAIDDFFASRLHRLPGGFHHLDQVLEEVRLCAAQTEELGPQLDAYFLDGNPVANRAEPHRVVP